MTGARSYTTKIWRQPSSIGFSSADALSTSMDPPGEPAISTRKRPCQKIQNGSEFPELVAQNSRNPQRLDSNPRDPCESNGFQDRRIQPLCHSSTLILLHLLATCCTFARQCERLPPILKQDWLECSAVPKSQS